MHSISRLGRPVRLSRLPSMTAVAVFFVSGPARAADVPDMSKLAGIVRWGGLVASLLVIVGAMVVLRLIEGVSGRFSSRFANRRPTIQKFESIARFAVYVAAVVVCLVLSLRLDSTTLAVVGGSLAVAVGFAMRDLVASFIAGITIMFDRPFQVGDRVQFAGEYGDILKIGLRSVRMNTLDDNIITIPNNKVLTEVTASGNWGALEMQTAFDFLIGVDQDVELAMELIREACLTSPYVYLQHAVPIFAKQMLLQNYVVMALKARPYVFDCKYEKPFETDVHLRVARAFREHGIHPPAFLHRGLVEGASAPVVSRRGPATS
jgi:small-conductance mechanosensitive channel